MFNLFKKKDGTQVISVEQVMEDKEGIIIDVRTEREYEQGSIKEALVGYDLTSGEFAEKLDSLDKEKTYYLYCASGNRSGKAARLMTEKGFENVHNLGGYNDLVESGFEKSDNSQ
ncbi:MAG: rhodanese-like domain-containing protein [Balneola sp.]